MPMRSFSLNEHRSHAGVHGEKRNPKAYEALCPKSERPTFPAGDRTRDARGPAWLGGVEVAATDAEAEDAFRAWLGHVEAGRIGKFAK